MQGEKECGRHVWKTHSKDNFWLVKVSNDDVSVMFTAADRDKKTQSVKHVTAAMALLRSKLNIQPFIIPGRGKRAVR